MQNRKLKLQELGRISIDEFKNSAKTPLVIVLDNIRSLNNIGSVFRTGDAFRIEKIYLCGITASPPHREIQKTAIGATESVDWEYNESTSEVLADLKKNNYTLIAIEQTEKSVPLDAFKVEKNKKYVIVLGNEVDGVQQSAIDLCDFTVEIPQIGTKHSLNISVCTGVVVWDFFQKIKNLG